MSIAEILAEDLIRAVIVNGNADQVLTESAENLQIIEAVTHTVIIDDAGGTYEVTDPAYLSVTVTDVEYKRREAVWYVTLPEAIAYLAKDVVVRF